MRFTSQHFICGYQPQQCDNSPILYADVDSWMT